MDEEMKKQEEESFWDHPVFKIFHALNQIPRGSDHEAEVARALEAYGKSKGYQTVRDASDNVIMDKAAGEGFEQAPTIIVQGHMDMVCEKDPDSDHDFLKDPIQMKEKDGWIMAEGTTMGADDGLGLSMGLALLDEEEPGPALRLIATTAEETSMVGSEGLDPKYLEADYLLNLDSEQEGEVTGGCAGGATGLFNMPLQRDVQNFQGLALSIDSMRGGHSGMDILHVNTNAIKAMGEWVRKVVNDSDARLVAFAGGTKHNAIPKEAKAIISYPEAAREEVAARVKEVQEDLQARLLKQEPDVKLTVKEVACDQKALDKESAAHFLSLIEMMPHGVYSMRADGVHVESSDNLAIASLGEDQADFTISVRSNTDQKLKELEDKIFSVVKTFQGDGVYTENYPVWEFRESSPLRDYFLKVYKEETGEEAKVMNIHAGLECAMFAQKNPQLEMISFGPTVKGAHTTKERASIDSTIRSYDLLKKLVQGIGRDSSLRV